MSKNIRELPFTELVERVSEIARLREEVESKIRGTVNDVYVRDIPRKEDWNFLIARTSLVFTAEYDTGTVSANTDDRTLTFSSNVTTSSDMTGRKIKIQGHDFIYDILSMSGTTGLVISPEFQHTENISSQEYSIFQPFYSLNPHFERFPKNGGLHLFRGGRKSVIPEIDYQAYQEEQIAEPNNNQVNCRLIGTDTAGNRVLEVMPPPKDRLASEYDYFRQLSPMRETTAGFIHAISAGLTAVVGSLGTTRFTEATTGDYFRIDNFGTGADSEWYKILAIEHDSSLTLEAAFGLSAATTAAYTICSAPQMPVVMHPAILYGSLAQMTADQDDPIALQYKQEYANQLTDGKRIYKTRIYNPQIEHVAEDFNYRR